MIFNSRVIKELSKELSEQQTDLNKTFVLVMPLYCKSGYFCPQLIFVHARAYENKQIKFYS